MVVVALTGQVIADAIKFARLDGPIDQEKRGVLQFDAVCCSVLSCIAV